MTALVRSAAQYGERSMLQNRKNTNDGEKGVLQVRVTPVVKAGVHLWRSTALMSKPHTVPVRTSAACM